LRKIEDLHDLSDDLLTIVRIVLLKSPGNTTPQMPLQDQRFDFVQGFLNRFNLMNNVHAVRVILDHTLDAAEVSFSISQSSQEHVGVSNFQAARTSVY
jgi:hypothetical protein